LFDLRAGHLALSPVLPAEEPQIVTTTPGPSGRGRLPRVLPAQDPAGTADDGGARERNRNGVRAHG
jgi:hypothetical protein